MISWNQTILTYHIIQVPVEMSYPSSATQNLIQLIVFVIQVNHFKTPFMHLISVGHAPWKTSNGWMEEKLLAS